MDSVTKNLIDAMMDYGLEYNWCDSEIIGELIGCGITQEDFNDIGAGDFCKDYFRDSEEE